MEKNDRFFKKFCEFSVILFCISIVVFAISFPALELSSNVDYMALSFISSIITSIASILVLVSAIILIVKICSDNRVSTSDKILWGIFLYLGNLFIIPFAINKFILKNEDYKYAKKYFIFELVTICIAILAFVFIFIQMISLMNF